MTTGAWPLSEGEDAVLLHAAESAFPGDAPQTIGVAVSGGGDSIALLHLFARVRTRRGGTVRAVTVDHRLRPEAAEEARFVGRFCKTLGVAHDTLVWEHGEIAGNLQDNARRARYGLIGGWARDHGISHVVLGHTADDQAETFLMELAREAGIDGLSGMRRIWKEDGVEWARPLLQFRRVELRDYLRRNGVEWLEDPSNADPRFARVKARRALEALGPLGITVGKLSAVTANLFQARQAVLTATAAAAERVASTSAGAVMLDRGAFRRLGQEVRRRILIGALRWISGAEYAPRADAVLRLQHAIDEGRDATLSGCRIKTTATEVQITREPRAVAASEGPTDALWDGRWRLSGPHEPDLTVRALGAEGLRQCPDWRMSGVSRAALVVSPAIWRGGRLVAAPLAGFGEDWAAEIVAGYHSFLISH